jgi:hypothetical protein
MGLALADQHIEVARCHPLHPPMAAKLHGTRLVTYFSSGCATFQSTCRIQTLLAVRVGACFRAASPPSFTSVASLIPQRPAGSIGNAGSLGLWVPLVERNPILFGAESERHLGVVSWRSSRANSTIQAR